MNENINSLSINSLEYNESRMGTNTTINSKINDSTQSLGNNDEHYHANITSEWLIQFISIYQQLSTDNLALIEKIYHENITFTDPIHRIEGLESLKSYFDGLYTNLSSCHFIIDHYLEQGNEATVFWTMTYQHSKLNSGKPVMVEGSSHLKASDGKIFYHRDYLDLGAMLYEQIPFLGNAIKWIKHKAAK